MIIHLTSSDTLVFRYSSDIFSVFDKYSFLVDFFSQGVCFQKPFFPKQQVLELSIRMESKITDKFFLQCDLKFVYLHVTLGCKVIYFIRFDLEEKFNYSREVMESIRKN